MSVPTKEEITALLEAHGVVVKQIHRWPALADVEIEIEPSDPGITLVTTLALAELLGSQDITIKAEPVGQSEFAGQRYDEYALTIEVVGAKTRGN